MALPIPKLTLFLLILAGGTAASLLAALLLAEFHHEITHPFLEAIDLRILSGIHAHDTPALTRLAFALTFIGSPLALVPTILAAAALLWAMHLGRDGAAVSRHRGLRRTRSRT